MIDSKSAAIQRCETLEKALDRFGDAMCAACFAALDVQRHIWIVQGHAQERPAMGEDETNALIRRLGDLDAFFLRTLRESA